MPDIRYTKRYIITADFHRDWLRFMKGTHIRNVEKTGCFVNNLTQVFEVIDEHENADGNKVMEVVYHTDTLDRIRQFQNEYEGHLSSAYNAGAGEETHGPVRATTSILQP